MNNWIFQSCNRVFAALFLLCITTNLPAQTSQQTIEYALPRVVKIFGAGGVRKLHPYSTGFLVSSQGHIATVWSHVLDSDEVTVVLDNGRRFQATVLGAEPQLDLAVLKLEGENLDLPFFDIDRAATVSSGTRVLAFSNMFQVAVGDEAVSVLHGVIAARTPLPTRRGTYETPYAGPVYVVDAITNNSGAGGGVLTSYDGKLLGMIGKELRNAQSNTWVNYAVPVTELKSIIGQIISGRYESQPRDIDFPNGPRRYHPIDFGLVLVPDVLYRTPAYIDAVLTGSPADKIGLQPDDLILFVNDELIQSCRMLREELGRLEAGDSLRLIVRRGDVLVSVETTAMKKEPK